jgi:iron complex outermembrane receptor protein
MSRRSATYAFALGFIALPASGEETTLPPVVVSTRLESVEAFDAPASVSVVDIADRAHADLAESLAQAPGVIARDRRNHAQDTQLSIRGFGARATFGVRGVRLYADGIPATMPDGQGQVSHLDLVAADRIEILRGPFSALYGNASGGVVQVFTADGAEPAQVRVQTAFGSDGERIHGARALGAIGPVGYHVAFAVAETDGWREHSASRRESANLKLRVPVGDDGTLDLVANGYRAPEAQDPLGLAHADARADPRRATLAALAFDTRKSTAQNQLGAVWRHALGGGHALRATAYAGHRTIEQFLAVPIAAQASPTSAGGVVDLAGDYGGVDLRWSWHGELASRAVEIDAGIDADRQRQHRRGFENFVDSANGIRGALRRDEINDARSVDRYAQAWWAFAPRWSALVGARASDVRFASDDRYVTAANPDDGGRVDYAQTTPVAGLVFAPRDDVRVHASAGRGFETPTFNELGYRADGGSGLAFDLHPARSRNFELGAKWRGTDGASLEAALFRADTADELAVARNVGGRSSYRNVGRARRQGVEISASIPLSTAWRVDIAATRLDATFRDAFAVCTAAGCTTPTALVAPGTRLPGVARDQAWLRAAWRDGGWSAAVQASAVGRVTVDDRGTEAAPGYARVDVEAACDFAFGDGTLRAFARIDNVFDRGYVGSVIVNEGNARYYEPGAARTWLAGLRWTWNAR